VHLEAPISNFDRKTCCDLSQKIIFLYYALFLSFAPSPTFPVLLYYRRYKLIPMKQ
jgi:hypothetical protein